MTSSNEVYSLTSMVVFFMFYFEVGEEGYSKTGFRLQARLSASPSRDIPSFCTRDKKAFAPCPGLTPATHVHRHEANASKNGKEQAHRVRQTNHLEKRSHKKRTHEHTPRDERQKMERKWYECGEGLRSVGSWILADGWQVCLETEARKPSCAGEAGGAERISAYKSIDVVMWSMWQVGFIICIIPMECGRSVNRTSSSDRFSPARKAEKERERDIIQQNARVDPHQSWRTTSRYQAVKHQEYFSKSTTPCVAHLWRHFTRLHLHSGTAASWFCQRALPILKYTTCTYS